MGSARRVGGGFGSCDLRVGHPLTACMVNDSDLGLQQLAMGTTEEEWAAGVNDDVSGETPDETWIRWNREGHLVADELHALLDRNWRWAEERARIAANSRKRRGDGASGSGRSAKEARPDPMLRHCRSGGGCFGGMAACDAPDCWVKGGTLKDTGMSFGQEEV